MTEGRRYGLRPQAATSETGLERVFRIEMKRDDMSSEKLVQGDPVLLQCPSTGAGGVGIVHLSSEASKNPNALPFVKIYNPLKDLFGLGMTDKCLISKYEGEFRRITTITVSEVNPGSTSASAVTYEDLELWAGISLAQLSAVAQGCVFDVTTSSGPKKGRKRRFSVNRIVAQDTPSSSDLTSQYYVPYWYDIRNSKVEIQGHSTPAVAPPYAVQSIRPEFSGLRGVEEQLRQLQRHIEMINRTLRGHNELSQLGLANAVLIHGVSGVGKSSVLNKLGEASWRKVVRIEDSILSPSPSKVEATIAKLFTEASSSQPSLILIDDVETLAGRGSECSSTAATLTRQIQKIAGSGVQIAASACRPFDVDQKLLGHFSEFIELPIPTLQSRFQILEGFAGSLAVDEILRNVAARTHAFTAADLKRLCYKACMAAVGSSEWVINGQSLTSHVAHIEAQESHNQPLRIGQAEFDQALLVVHPSVMNEAYIEVPEVRWAQIAGSEEVKEKLWDAVELPLNHPDFVERLNLQTNGGILLYGPPGCSKTLTAKALATESGLNFIAVKGPELISKYVGESELKIREVFRKARAAVPSIIFFDEIDSIAPNRGSGGHEGLNTVATLLNEMDGVEDVKKVLVLAATNRPDAIDPALLRPGRLGATLFVGPPDSQAIETILKMHTAKMHAMEELDLEQIAAKMSENLFQCYSGADVAALCQAAGIKCARDMRRDSTVTGIRNKDLLAALEEAKPSLSRSSVQLLKNWRLAGVASVA